MDARCGCDLGMKFALLLTHAADLSTSADRRTKSTRAVPGEWHAQAAAAQEFRSKRQPLRFR